MIRLMAKGLESKWGGKTFESLWAMAASLMDGWRGEEVQP